MTDKEEKAELYEYIARMTRELAKLADDCEDNILQYLLRIASIKAKDAYLTHSKPELYSQDKLRHDMLL